MNDFTRDELDDLISWGNVYTEFGNSWTDKMHRPLLLKIQSLIDSYDCEHLPVIDLDDNFLPSSHTYCKKCGIKL